MSRRRLWVLLVAAVLTAACASATPQTQSPPAGDLHDNLELLADVPKNLFDREMQVFEKALGVDCVHCHIQLEWDLDDVPAKIRTREMIRMERAVSTSHFDDVDPISCWTCHRGETTPSVQPTSPTAPPRYTTNPFPPSRGPAGGVYKNLQLFGDLDADRLKDVMEGYNAALGVVCTHCHVINDWADDRKREKELTRRMVEMEAEIEREYFDGADKVSCWTCHRGGVEPARDLPPELSPDL